MVLNLAACAPATTGTTMPAPPSPPSSPATWTLAWSDEFDGPAGAPVDATKWVAETGGQARLSQATHTMHDDSDSEGCAIVVKAGKRAQAALQTELQWPA